MRQLALNHTSCLVEFGDFLETSYKEDQIDWRAVNKRIRQAILDAGIEFRDVAAFVGLDMSDNDYMAKYKKLPKLRTATAVAAFIGVPASWILTGKGTPPQKVENQVTEKGLAATNGFERSSDSTVMQGTNSGTMIINNMSAPMSEQKQELLRIFDTIGIRYQTKLLHFAYSLEDESNKVS